MTGSAVTSEPPSQHLFLTGHPGVGKTTIVVETVLEILRCLKQKGTNERVRIRGFYTEECRTKDGQRAGFDIVYWPSSVTSSSCAENEMKRAPLARIGKPKKGDPAVGKFLVDTESVAKTAVPSIFPTIEPPTDNENKDKYIDVIILDEIGKMELLCESFLPAVQQIFKQSEHSPTIILGTIPTPRYGRVIPAVESVRARDDVTVVHIKKYNRDMIKKEVKHIFLELLSLNNNEKNYVKGNNDNIFQQELKQYLYERPIGSSSTLTEGSLKSNHLTGKSTSTMVSSVTNPETPIACGPLTHNSIQPRVIILGETASPKPTKEGTEYSERSFWLIFAHWFEMEYNPTALSPHATFNESDSACEKQYFQLKDLVMSKGIGFWDVLSNVHEKDPKTSRSKRQKRNGSDQIPNNIEDFIRNNSSVVALAFIGVKARKTFGKHFKVQEKETKISLASRSIELLVLPSSSRANTSMTLKSKVDFWSKTLSPFC